MGVRIQLRRTKGWRMPEGTVSVARPGPFGNPYPVTSKNGWIPKEHGLNAEQSVSAFRTHLANSSGLQEMAARKLVGKNLACWCAPDAPCHADVLLEYVNSLPQTGAAA